jgi:hypothetical protein
MARPGQPIKPYRKAFYIKTKDSQIDFYKTNPSPDSPPNDITPHTFAGGSTKESTIWYWQDETLPPIVHIGRVLPEPIDVDIILLGNGTAANIKYLEDLNLKKETVEVHWDLFNYESIIDKFTYNFEGAFKANVKMTIKVIRNMDKPANKPFMPDSRTKPIIAPAFVEPVIHKPRTTKALDLFAQITDLINKCKKFIRKIKNAVLNFLAPVNAAFDLLEMAGSVFSDAIKAAKTIANIPNKMIGKLKGLYNRALLGLKVAGQAVKDTYNNLMNQFIKPTSASRATLLQIGSLLSNISKAEKKTSIMITLFTPEGKIYIGRIGDTMQSVAKLFNITPRDLRKANKYMKTITPGGQVKIPQTQDEVKAAEETPSSNALDTAVFPI